MSTIIGLVSTFRLPLHRAKRAEKPDTGKRESRPKSEKSTRKGRETGSQGAAMPDLTYETIDKNYEF